jgi:hypothetical protein
VIWLKKGRVYKSLPEGYSILVYKRFSRRVFFPSVKRGALTQDELLNNLFSNFATASYVCEYDAIINKIADW